MAFKDFVKTVKSETGDAIEVTKLKTKVSKEKSEIKDNFGRIGEAIYNDYKAGVEVDPKLVAFLVEIDASKDKIEGYNKEISRVKMN